MSGPSPLNVQTDEELRARFDKAVERRWLLLEMDSPEADRPGKHAHHVFDFEDGMRLLVSKDDLGTPTCPDLVICLSASVHNDRPGQPQWSLVTELLQTNESEGPHVATQRLLDAATEHFRFLSGYAGPIKLLGLSHGKGVPHWRISDTLWNAHLWSPEAAQ